MLETELRSPDGTVYGATPLSMKNCLPDLPAASHQRADVTASTGRGRLTLQLHTEGVLPVTLQPAADLSLFRASIQLVDPDLAAEHPALQAGLTPRPPCRSRRC